MLSRNVICLTLHGLKSYVALIENCASTELSTHKSQ